MITEKARHGKAFEGLLKRYFAFSLEPHTSIAGGDTANTCTIHLFNHYGTHLDGPMHFYGKGIPLDQVPVSYTHLDVYKRQGTQRVSHRACHGSSAHHRGSDGVHGVIFSYGGVSRIHLGA